MKVDLPQLESTARPMMMGVLPSFSAIWSEEGGEARRLLLGTKAEAVAATRAKKEMESFVV